MMQQQMPGPPPGQTHGPRPPPGGPKPPPGNDQLGSATGNLGCKCSSTCSWAFHTQWGGEKQIAS
jgi:hypothetical protein